AKLAGEPFVEFNILEERQVGSPEARAAHGTWTARANGGLRGIGISEGAYVEPSAEGVRRAGVGIANEIRAAANRRSTKETTGAAVGWVGCEPVRPRVRNTDEGITREALLHLRLERVIVRREEVHEE